LLPYAGQCERLRFTHRPTIGERLARVNVRIAGVTVSIGVPIAQRVRSRQPFALA
jgi:hypothetical protein